MVIRIRIIRLMMWELNVWRQADLIPDVGYVTMWSYSDATAKPNDNYFVSKTVDDSQVHRLKDNKMGDVSKRLER